MGALKMKRTSFLWALIFLSSPFHIMASFEAEIGTSYRQDHFDWNIAGPYYDPDVLSELTWSDLQIAQVEAACCLSLSEKIYVRGRGDYGWILSGKNQDSDYFVSGRQLEFSRSNNRADQGNVFDGSIGIGHIFCTAIPRFEWGIVVGYSFHGQHLHMTDGMQTVNLLDDYLGPFDGLHSTYKTLWQGPWVGVDVSYEFPTFVSCLGSFEYHRAMYRAKGNWNLRRDFYQDFEHETNGNGFLARGEICYKLFSSVSIAAIGQYQIWDTDAGRDRTYFFEDEDSFTPLVGDLPLNNVHWNSWSLGLSFVVDF